MTRKPGIGALSFDPLGDLWSSFLCKYHVVRDETLIAERLSGNVPIGYIRKSLKKGKSICLAEEFCMARCQITGRELLFQVCVAVGAQRQKDTAAGLEYPVNF